MNSVLFDEFPILVDRVLASKIGLNEAVIIQQIHYWIMQNKRQKKNYYNNKWWTYNTLEEWRDETFFFWSLSTVKRTFKKLEKEGLLIVGNYNRKAYDRTKWYTIDYEKLEERCNNSIGQLDTMEEVNMNQSIPKTKQRLTTEITQPLVVVEKIKSYFNLDDNDIKKVASTYSATGKDISYLVEKLELVKSKPNTRDITGYLISALKNDYKVSVDTKNINYTNKSNKFANFDQNFLDNFEDEKDFDKFIENRFK